MGNLYGYRVFSEIFPQRRKVDTYNQYIIRFKLMKAIITLICYKYFRGIYLYLFTNALPALFPE